MIFLERQRHHGVHAKIREIFDPLHYIQNLADAMWPDVLAGGILRIEHADVKLVNDEVAEGRRTESRIVPGIIVRIAHDAVAVGISIEFQFARIRIAFEAFAARSDHVKAIKVAVLESWHEAGPKTIGVL